MSTGITLLLGTAAAVSAALLAVLLLRRSRHERHATPAGAPFDFGRALAANTLGFLLLGSLAAGSGLLADALCRLVQSQG